MARRLPAVDAVVVGVGWTGAIIGKELAAAGLKVAALERGPARWSAPDFQAPEIHDELLYGVRLGLNQNAARETYTFRNTGTETALPMRRWGAFTPGDGLGGGGAHWSGAYYRYDENEFRLRSHYTRKYGAGIFDPTCTAQDWPVSYAELEPHYDRFEYLCGISGRAGNIAGKLQAGPGNRFEAPRARDFPNPPMKVPYASAIFGRAAASLGYHPFIQPSANLSRPYRNTEGLEMGACMYCGFCSNHGCEHFAKSSPQVCLLPAALKLPGFDLRTGAEVLRVETTPDRGMATGVTYLDHASGEELFQPADLVFLCTFAVNNPRLMLLSGLGEAYDPATGRGQVGRSFTHQTTASVALFFDRDDLRLNQFMGAGALAVTMDDLNCDNFDHTGSGFVGGGYVQVQVVGQGPIRGVTVPAGTPGWGAAWKAAARRWYQRATLIQITATAMPSRATVLDLDPTYTDALGRPLLRMTYDFSPMDQRLAQFLVDKAVEIGRATGASRVEPRYTRGQYDSTRYQTTHLTGGAPMGDTPASGAVNRYGQLWGTPNVFSAGASLFPHNPAHNPTGTVGAMAYWTARAVLEQYVKAPGPLVQA